TQVNDCGGGGDEVRFSTMVTSEWRRGPRIFRDVYCLECSGLREKVSTFSPVNARRFMCLRRGRRRRDHAQPFPRMAVAIGGQIHRLFPLWFNLQDLQQAALTRADSVMVRHARR